MPRILYAGIGSSRKEELKRSVLQFRDSSDESALPLLSLFIAFTFPSELSSEDRKYIHGLVRQYGLYSHSNGKSACAGMLRDV